MSRRAAAALAVLLLAPAVASGNFVFPDPLPPEEYGNLLLNRTAEANGVKPVSFSHWQHRVKYTCRVCHFELQFNFEAGTTEITEEANRAGMFCGACHDGKELFGHTREQDCVRCHNGDLRRGVEGFSSLWRLPEAKFGNRIDWQAALDEGKIKPKNQLGIEPSAEVGFAGTILLDAVWPMAPDASFPHGKHTRWLDCNDCHPYIFNIKKKFTEGLEMSRVIEGEFCGICHRNVAFPLVDCVRCHPHFEKAPDYKQPVSR